MAQILAELQGRYGEDFSGRPIIIYECEDDQAAETLKEYLPTAPETTLPEGVKENFIGFRDSMINPTF